MVELKETMTDILTTTQGSEDCSTRISLYCTISLQAQQPVKDRQGFILARTAKDR
jgi:hypothetical protein